jgi:hypothetical protein
VRPKGRVAYKPNTTRAYERALVNHIEGSELARLKVAEVRRSDVQALVDDLLAEGLALGTVSNVLNPVQVLYRRLIDRDVLAHNPATRLDLPAKGNARAKRIASSGEAAELLAALPDNDRPLWAAAFYGPAARGASSAPGPRHRSRREPDPRRAGLGPVRGGDRAEVQSEQADDPTARGPARPPGRAAAP